MEGQNKNVREIIQIQTRTRIMWTDDKLLRRTTQMGDILCQFRMKHDHRSHEMNLYHIRGR